MTTKYYIRWCFTDELGNMHDGYCNIDWFDTLEQAYNFIKRMQKNNGSYFQCKPPELGNYEHFVQYKNLLCRIKELEKEFM